MMLQLDISRLTLVCAIFVHAIKIPNSEYGLYNTKPVFYEYIDSH